MSKQTYKIASDAGATHFQQELGAEVEAELDESTERALVCAGWIEPAKPKAKGS